MLRRSYQALMDLLDRQPSLKWYYYRLARFCTTNGIHPPLSSRSARVEDSWRHQHAAHSTRNPLHFVQFDDSIPLLFADVLPFLGQGANILEIGCNAGRNLDYLRGQGFSSFTGIEIGSEAEKAMQEHFPATYAMTRYLVGNAYDEIRKLPDAAFDLVFAHSVLINIAPKWNGLFREMARVARGFILTMESEGGITAYPRDLETMFRRQGFVQILYKYYNLRGQRRVLLPHYDRREVFRNNTIRLFVRET
ncbi:MAG: class I SAM-dependent methyltransferase [Thermodesulfobacteriota bacterium]